MALDEADHRVFVVTRKPAQLVVLDSESGAMVGSLPCVQDADDLYYDAGRKRIYVPGGEGLTSVFEQTDADHYRLLANLGYRRANRTVISRRAERDSTVFSSPFRRGGTTARNSGFMPCKARGQAGCEAQESERKVIPIDQSCVGAPSITLFAALNQ